MSREVAGFVIACMLAVILINVTARMERRDLSPPGWVGLDGAWHDSVEWGPVTTGDYSSDLTIGDVDLTAVDLPEPVEIDLQDQYTVWTDPSGETWIRFGEGKEYLWDEFIRAARESFERWEAEGQDGGR